MLEFLGMTAVRRLASCGVIASAMLLTHPTVASAQATTTCNQFGAAVTCNTTADPMLQLQQQQRDMNEQMRRQQSDLAAASAQRRAAGGAQQFSWKDVPPQPCSSWEKYARSEMPSYCAARDVAAHRKAVGDLIAAGKCDDALKGALGTGDLQFAREVRDFCGAK